MTLPMPCSPPSRKFRRDASRPTDSWPAYLIGYPKNARLVARVLSHAEYYGDYPCHRVVNATGRLAPGWAAQATLLQAEGVALIDATHVSLKTYQWDM